MLAGDALTVQLFIGGAALSVGLGALTFSTGGQPHIKRGLWITASVLTISAMFWAPITELFPDLGLLTERYISVTQTLFDLMLVSFFLFAWKRSTRLERNGTSTTGNLGSTASTRADSILADKGVWAGSRIQNLAPSFRGTFKSNFSRARLYVEQSTYFPDVMGSAGWTKREPLIIAELHEVREGQSIWQALVSSYQQNGQTRWRWGSDAIQPNDNRYVFIPRNHYQGRVTVAVEGQPDSFTYFTVFGPEDDGEPLFVGEQQFAFAVKWETR